MKKKNPSSKASGKIPVVAIGASAGGQEAITDLLLNLPPKTGLAYVYIQHLKSSRKSMLSSILSRATTMSVQEATHNLKIKADHLYIIPPDYDLSVEADTLKLLPRDTQGPDHLPIDSFFFSLAKNRKERAIGVVLSGHAADGALGLKAIKMAGGLTYVQDDSAKYQDMPLAAILEGGADKRLSPAEIANEISYLSVGNNLKKQLKAEKEIGEENSTEDISSILDLIKKSTGVDFSHYKINTIRRRIVRRMLLYRLESLSDYLQYIIQNPKETNILYQDLLINVTCFFRDTDALKFIKEKLLLRIFKEKGASDIVRIWVPACSTGEEAYSLAMLISDYMEENSLSRQVQIFATDLSEAAIEKARLGIYSESEVSGVPQKKLQKYFKPADAGYRVNKSIRDLCIFAPHNIFKDPPFSRLDLLSCCNLLIYLDPILQKKVMATLHYALNSNGFLVLGKSETIGNSQHLFTPIDKKAKAYSVKKNSELPLRPYIGGKATENESKSRASEIRIAAKEKNRHDDISKVVDHILLTQYAPASVIVNAELEILQFRGSTGSFLEPAQGKASLNLLKMARPGLSFELRNAMRKAIKSKDVYKKEGIEIRVNDRILDVNIEIVPLPANNEQEVYLILFKEAVQSAQQSSESISKNQRVRQLELELMAAKEDMRSVIEEQEAVNEELQSANEEIVSSNEELQSINEELETSKEEVESTNEELRMINHEMQLRNEQLAEAHEYSEALFTIIREAAVVLDHSLIVKSANKAFFNIFNLPEENVEGLSFFQMGKGKMDIPLLHRLLEKELPDKNQVSGYELTHKFPDLGTKTLIINACKLEQKSHNRHLILLAIEDITAYKAAEQIISNRETWFRSMADNAPVMIWVTGKDKGCTFVNKTRLDFTGDVLDNVLNDGWLRAIHPDDKQKISDKYNESFKKKIPFSIDYRLRRKDGEYRWVLNTGKPNFSHDGKFLGFIGSCTEIHDQRMINAELDERVKFRTRALHESNKNLEHSNLELQQFAYVASHDLQEPLRKIITFSDLLKKSLVQKGITDEKEYSAKISKNALRMRGLINDLLNFSRTTSTDEKYSPVDLNNLIQEVLSTFDLSIQQKQVKVHLDSLPQVEGISIQLHQLFHNLVSNALKFIDRRRSPELSIYSAVIDKKTRERFPELKENKIYHEITVKDNGIGFDEAFAEQIFVIFQRLNDHHSFQGTGIGLALCKKIVQNHNGIIYGTSKNKEGAEFHVILPQDMKD